MHVEDPAGTGAADTSTTTATTTDASATDASTAATPADGKTATGESSTTSATGVPEAYSFQMPEGVTLDQAAVDRFTPLFKEAGLSQEGAQKLVDAYAALMAEQSTGSEQQAEQWYADRRAREIAEGNERDLTALRADAELGGAKFDGVHQRVIAAIGAVGTPEMRATFDRLGLGNNPEVVRLVHRLIDYRAPDPGHQPAGGGGVGGSDPARTLYPNL